MAATTHAKPHPEFGIELVRDWEPEDGPRAYIVLVHGLAEHSGRYEDSSTALSKAGFHVRSFDLIGAGGSGGPRWDIDDWGRFHDQVGSHVDWARRHGKPVVLMGHSLGGNIALGYSLSERTKPDLLVLSAPALTGGAAWQRLLAPILARIAPRVAIPNPVNGEHLSRDPAVAEAYFADPLVVTKSTVRLGAHIFAQIDDLNTRMDELTVPTLVIHGGDDKLVPTWCTEPLEAVDCVERKVYEGLRHETMNEPEGPEVIADIVAWINERV